jgi:hypothetical protein
MRADFHSIISSASTSNSNERVIGATASLSSAIALNFLATKHAQDFV